MVDVVPSGLKSKHMIRYLLSRIGCLMMMAGSILLVIGAAAVRSDQPGFNFLSIGLLLSVFGLLLWNRLRAKKPIKPRFSKLKKREQERPKAQDDRQGWEDRFNE